MRAILGAVWYLLIQVVGGSVGGSVEEEMSEEARKEQQILLKILIRYVTRLRLKENVKQSASVGPFQVAGDKQLAHYVLWLSIDSAMGFQLRRAGFQTRLRTTSATGRGRAACQVIVSLGPA